MYVKQTNYDGNSIIEMAHHFMSISQQAIFAKAALFHVNEKEREKEHLVGGSQFFCPSCIATWSVFDANLSFWENGLTATTSAASLTDTPTFHVLSMLIICILFFDQKWLNFARAAAAILHFGVQKVQTKWFLLIIDNDRDQIIYDSFDFEVKSNGSFQIYIPLQRQIWTPQFCRCLKMTSSLRDTCRRQWFILKYYRALLQLNSKQLVTNIPFYSVKKMFLAT